MQLKTMTGLTIFVLLFGIAATPLMHYADAAYGSSNSGYATAKDAMKDKAKTAMKDKAKTAMKDKAKTAMKDKAKAAATGTSSTTSKVSIVKGSASPGCDTTNSCYNPFDAKVSVGGIVTWKNDDTASHTATSGKNATPDGMFDSGMITPGKTFSFKSTKAGNIDYFCLLHPWMKGKVTVS